MTPSGLRYRLAPFSKRMLGRGAYSTVYKATEEGSGRQVAVKKSRASRGQKRTTLQHEARVLQLLKGPAAIPTLYGYGHLTHFEYMAMERLGPSIAEQQKKGGAGITVKTVIRVLDQTLAALQHIHSLGIVHRDIKPDNLLCALDNDFTVKVIDFGAAKPFSRGQPRKPYDPLKEHRGIVGTLYWASLNAHNGIDLSPCDDLESLAFVALFLLRGNLPWKPRPHLEDEERSQEIVRLMKSACSGPVLSSGFPDDFGELLTYSRTLNFGQLPDYAKIRHLFTTLAKKMGYSPTNEPLDWTPCYPKITNPTLEEPDIFIPDQEGDRYRDDDDIGEDSYYEYDLDQWPRLGNRDKDVTLPTEQEAKLDGFIPPIIEITET